MANQAYVSPALKWWKDQGFYRGGPTPREADWSDSDREGTHPWELDDSSGDESLCEDVVIGPGPPPLREKEV